MEDLDVVLQETVVLLELRIRHPDTLTPEEVGAIALDDIKNSEYTDCVYSLDPVVISSGTAKAFATELSLAYLKAFLADE